MQKVCLGFVLDLHRCVRCTGLCLLQPFSWLTHLVLWQPLWQELGCRVLDAPQEANAWGPALAAAAAGACHYRWQCEPQRSRGVRQGQESCGQGKDLQVVGNMSLNRLTLTEKPSTFYLALLSMPACMRALKRAQFERPTCCSLSCAKVPIAMYTT
jgi:hypothetical protein